MADPDVRLKRLRTLRLKRYNEIVESGNDTEVEPLFSFDEYFSGGQCSKCNGYTRYKWRCDRCLLEFEGYVYGKLLPKCPTCFPNEHISRSMGESKMADFIASISSAPVELNKRINVNGRRMEIDIYLEGQKLGFEFDGLWWHSELAGKDRRYHLDKTMAAGELGIRIIHVREDEWANKPDIVKSIISNAIGVCRRRVYARNCRVAGVPSAEYASFMRTNHIQGYIPSPNRIGLYEGDSLVQVIGFGASRFEGGRTELHRMCTAIGVVVVGGLSRLMANSGVDDMITYCDRRLFDGAGYRAAGFRVLGFSEPGYSYFHKNDTSSVVHRIKFQKHKLRSILDVFNPNLSEWENMVANGWNRIWDCGNIKMQWQRR